MNETIRLLRECTEILRASNDSPEMPQVEDDGTPMWNPATETIDEFMARAKRYVEGK